MAAESELASLYIDFSTRNSKQVDKEIDQKRGRLMLAAEAAKRYGAAAFAAGQAAAKSFADAAVAAARYARFAAIGTVGFLAKGLGGTKEAETLGNAFTFLSRVVGDLFAPAIRGVTQAFIELSRWLLSLDADTRRAAQAWAAFAAAAVAFVAAAPGLLAGIRLLSAAVTMFASKWVAIPALILAVGVALIYLAGEGETFEERMVSGWHNIELVIVAVKARLAEFGAFMAVIGRDFLKLAATNPLKGGAIQWAATIAEAEVAGQAAFKRVADQGVQQAAVNKRNIQEAIANLKKNIAGENGAGGLLGMVFKPLMELFGAGGAWDRIADAMNNPQPLQVRHSINVTGGQQLWETLQRSTVGNKQDQQIQKLDQIRVGIDKMNRDGVKLRNLPEAVGP